MPNESAAGIASRRAAIVRLLETMDDHLPTDPRSQWQSFGAQPGEKATQRVTCRACSGDGQVNTRKGLEPCDNCDGRGWYLVDGYTGQRENQHTTLAPLQKMTSAEREAWRLQIDSGIARAQSQMSRPASEQDSIAEANLHPYRWERERDRMRKRYDHQTLACWLEAMRSSTIQMQRARAAVISVYQHRIVEPTATLETDSELGLRLLAWVMPDPIRAPGMVREQHPAATRVRMRAA